MRHVWTITVIWIIKCIFQCLWNKTEGTLVWDNSGNKMSYTDWISSQNNATLNCGQFTSTSSLSIPGPILGVNFINVLRGAFILSDPKSTKKTVKLLVFFSLLGSARAKAAHRKLMKLTPGPSWSLQDCSKSNLPLCQSCKWHRSTWVSQLYYVFFVFYANQCM